MRFHPWAGSRGVLAGAPLRCTETVDTTPSHIVGSFASGVFVRNWRSGEPRTVAGWAHIGGWSRELSRGCIRTDA